LARNNLEKYANIFTVEASFIGKKRDYQAIAYERARVKFKNE